MSEDFGGYETFIEETAPALALDCHTAAWESGDHSYLRVSCLGNEECFVYSSELLGSDQPHQKHEHGEAAITQQLKTNTEKADLYARALSHLVLLLQQDYRQRHAANPNDPFAKP
jgi:hypothetical protein